jgi:putative hydrolase of the HAD superfamily
MTPRAIVFDFGNVVGYFSHRRAAERLAPQSRLSTDEFQRRVFGSLLEDRYERGIISTAEFRDAVRHETGLECGDDFFDESYADIFWHNRPVCALLPELTRRHRLLLLSNTNELHAGKFLTQFAEELRCFRTVLLSHEVGARKPEREVFERATQLANCRPEEVLFFDDIEANVAGARDFGWNGVVFTSADDVRRALTG